MSYKKLLVRKNLLERLFFIDPEKGSIRWRESGTGRRMNQEAGTVNSDGYRQIGIDNILHYAHHLIWLYTTGRYPEDQIDHIDRNPSNNRIDNLRELTNQEQQFNRSMTYNKEEPMGVSFCSGRKRPYKARISTDGNQVYLGHYKTPEEAHNAYLNVKKQHHTIL